MSYKRACPNFIQTFRDWVAPRSQLEIELIDWAAMFCIGTALRRRIAFTRTSAFLGSWDCYPYTYIIVVGPSGIGKTTAVNYAFDLLDQCITLSKPATFSTIEGIADDLTKSPDYSIYMTVGEMSDITQKDRQGKIYEFLNTLYDGKASIRIKTMQRSTEFSDKPCFNLFAGTTPEWISQNISLSTLNGGFGSRVCWLYIPGLRQRKLYYDKEIPTLNLIGMEKALVADLNHFTTLEGAYTIQKDAMEFMVDWFEKLPGTIQYKRISGYIMRKHVFAHKLALIHHVAWSDSKEVTIQDFKNAISYLDAAEKKLPRIFEGVGKNTSILDMREIQRFIRENPGVQESRLKSEFQAVAQPGRLNVLLEDMKEARLIRTENGNMNGKLYFIGELGGDGTEG